MQFLCADPAAEDEEEEDSDFEESSEKSSQAPAEIPVEEGVSAILQTTHSQAEFKVEEEVVTNHTSM